MGLRLGALGSAPWLQSQSGQVGRLLWVALRAAVEDGGVWGPQRPLCPAPRGSPTHSQPPDAPPPVASPLPYPCS